jgi:putative FmdB family regulatory protein
MPRYEFRCPACDWHGLLWKSMNHRNKAICPTCGEDMSRHYSPLGMPNTQMASIDNKDFNNGQGVYDDGLGEVIHSRRHRQEVMERKGLHEVSKYDRDSFTKDREHTPMPFEQAKNQFEEAEAMVKSGEWKEGLSEKRVHEIESGGGKDAESSEE